MKQQSALKSFMSALIVLVVLFFFTGFLLYSIPGANSHWMWVLSPLLVLASDSGAMIIAISLFLLLIGGAVHVLKETGLIETIIQATVKRYQGKSFTLMAVLVCVFMSMGAFIGVFEEVIPLVPMMIILSRRMGWDDLTGLGISVLACGLGFAAAVTNPFTIGVAQELSNIPIFSGALLRMGVFLTTYVSLLAFLWWPHRHKTAAIDMEEALVTDDTIMVSKKAKLFFILMMGLMAGFLAVSPFISVFRDVSLPFIALVFVITAVGVGLYNGSKRKWIGRTFLKGAADMSPAILLILLATGIKHIMVEGGLLTLLLETLTSTMLDLGELKSLYMIFLTVLVLNFFIGSGSAKAFLVMPVVIPIVDMLGVSRQLGVLAFQFGDGFSNVLYPTNAVLLIALGISGVSYGKWLKFVFPIQLVLMVLSLLWIFVAFKIGYGG